MVKIIFILCAGLLFCSTFAQTNKGLHKGQTLPVLKYVALDKSNKIIDWNRHNDNVFLIDFWATWCAPCIQSIPHMDSLISKYKGKKVKFISITYEPENLVRKFLKVHPMYSEIGIDSSFKMFREYNGWAIPNIVLVNSAGKFAGRIHPNQLNENVINLLLAKKVPELENTKEDMFDPVKVEEYFRSFLEKQKSTDK